MNTTREVVAPAMRAAAEDMCGGDAERIFTSDTRDLMGFFVILRKLLREVSRQRFGTGHAYSIRPFSLTILVRNPRLHVQRLVQANPWSSRQDLLLHDQLHPLS
jgi:hypothetical protein